MIELLKIAARNLLRYKRRTFLTSLLITVTAIVIATIRLKKRIANLLMG